MIVLVLLACGQAAPEVPATTLDEMPGPSDGWLTPRVHDPSPLRVGMTLAEAERSWQVSDRALGPIRGVGGLIDAQGKSKALLDVDGDRVRGISFLLEPSACAVAQARLVRQYGPHADLHWTGATVEAGYRARDNGCTVFWKARKVE